LKWRPNILFLPTRPVYYNFRLISIIKNFPSEPCTSQMYWRMAGLIFNQSNKTMENNRRKFLKQLGLGTMGLAVLPNLPFEALGAKKMFFKISLAEWSLHKTLFDGKMTNMQFPEIAANKFGIHAVEYVNSFFKDKAKDHT